MEVIKEKLLKDKPSIISYENIEETLNHVEEYCGEHDITFDLKEISLFDD